MDLFKIRKIFLDFFASKNHQIIESSSLIPADPTVLLTTAGMQQFVPYLSGKIESPYHRAASVQKCFRTSDIDEVGDECHHTFFEMLGNWSFGDYFKKEAIEMALELLADKKNGYGLEKNKIWVSVFKGDKDIFRDEESIRIWQNNGISKERIKEFGKEDNFWGPVGEIGPCGPCSEIYYDRGKEFSNGKCELIECQPGCCCGRFVEIWNLVFMEYNQTNDGKYEKLPNKNIDTGAGLERIACVLQRTKSNFETDLFLPLIKKIEEISPLPYLGSEKAYRVIADHLRGACFLIGDGILPSKEDRGYILRRILRRAIRYGNFLKIKKGFLPKLAIVVINQYKEIYPELGKNKNDILTVIQNEEENFEKTIERGLKAFEEMVDIAYTLGDIAARKESSKKFIKKISGDTVFFLYQTFGFPFEMTKEMAAERGIYVDEDEFKKELEKHQELSRAGAQKKFGGHGLGKEGLPEEDKNKITKLHTATHLLHATLRQLLGEHVQQAGSDINPERLRFDFSHTSKLSDEEIKLIEKLVNEKIKENLSVKTEEMPYEKAIKSGALAFFKERYPQNVKVYSIGSSTGSESPFSREICAGPHVENTSELGTFKIIKEESSGAGMRRIKATLV